MEEKKPSKTGAIIATVATALICGCSGIIACVFGILIATGQEFEQTVNNNTSTVTYPTWAGIGLLCLSVIFIAVPVVVGVLTLRKKKPAAVTTVPPTY